MTTRARRPAARVAALLSLPPLFAGCAPRLVGPDLGELYDRAARSEHTERNPVVLIPGVLGSRLVHEENGSVVWGVFRGDFADPRRPSGARRIALPMRPGAPLSSLTDAVVADGALDTVRLRFLGLPLSVSAYVHVLLALGVGGYRDEELGLAGAIDYGDDHFTCFQFAYDWRRDVAESAAALHAFLVEKRAYVAGELARRYGIERTVRFDVVAHSMGSLVLRYYLRYGDQPLADDGSLPEPTWAGAELVERAVLVAPPNAGSVHAFVELLEGTKIGPLQPRYPPALVGTMPAVYQLLPRPRHGAWPAEYGDVLDPTVWEERGWGLADPRQARVLERLLPDEPDPAVRRAIALDHLAKCLARARQLFGALDRPGVPPPGTQVHLVAGDAVRTPSAVAVERGRVRVVERAPGDGTVTRASALLDERTDADWGPTLRSPLRWSRVTFLFEDHLGLTRSPAFIDNLLYLLLEEPRDGPWAPGGGAAGPAGGAEAGGRGR